MVAVPRKLMHKFDTQTKYVVCIRFGAFIGGPAGPNMLVQNIGDITLHLGISDVMDCGDGIVALARVSAKMALGGSTYTHQHPSNTSGGSEHSSDCPGPL